VLHGDIPQKQRTITTDGFRNGRFPVLVCTDVAARGLDIENVQMVIQMEPPRDAETYIHRSGRTGRAGKTGKSIMFYTTKKTGMMKSIERKMGQKFKRIGAPQRGDIAATAAEETSDKIKAIPETITKVFKDMAEELLKELDPAVALANAFALISGYTKETTVRSVLSCSRGFVTVQAVTNSEIRHAGYVFVQLENLIGNECRQQVRDMTLLKSRMGAVFDVPEKMLQQVLDAKKPWISFERVTEVPELEEKGGRGRGRGRGGRGGRGRGRGFTMRRRGNFSSRGRSRGSFSSRGRSRGRGRGRRGRGVGK